jgi:hypothetical protein
MLEKLIVALLAATSVLVAAAQPAVAPTAPRTPVIQVSTAASSARSIPVIFTCPTDVGSAYVTGEFYSPDRTQAICHYSDGSIRTSPLS